MSCNLHFIISLCAVFTKRTHKRQIVYVNLFSQFISQTFGLISIKSGIDWDLHQNPLKSSGNYIAPALNLVTLDCAHRLHLLAQ
jgi:hypothetical protein